MDNFRAALLMVAGMALFAVEDVFMKLLAEGMPAGEVLVLGGILGTTVLCIVMRLRGQRIISRDLLRPVVLIRSAGEGLTAAFFVAALGMGDLASAAAILQAMPLAMTLGAALFLGETVGWRRWLSIAVGFVGVLMIVRPGSAAFQPASVLAVAAVAALVMRDLVTRVVPKEVPSNLLTAAAFAAVVPAGALMLLMGSAPLVRPDTQQGVYLLAGIAFGLVGYTVMVAATRVGEVGVIAPFRYSRLVFALILAVLVFGERPDAMTLLGAAVIVVSGSYTMAREARLRRQAARAHRAATGKTG